MAKCLQRGIFGECLAWGPDDAPTPPTPEEILGAADDAWNNATSSATEAWNNARSSTDEAWSNAQDAGSSAVTEIQNLHRDTPVFLQKAGHDLATSVQDAGREAAAGHNEFNTNFVEGLQEMGRNVGSFDLQHSWDSLSNTVGHWVDTAAETEQNKVNRTIQNAKNWQEDPMKEWHNVTRMASGYAASQTQTGANAFSRWTGGSGDGLKDAGVSEDVREEGKLIHGVGVGAGKVVAGVVINYFTAGAGSAAGYLLMADGVNQLAGGSGNSLADVGMNPEWQTGVRVVAATSGSGDMSTAASEGATSAGASSAVANTAGGAAAGATYAGTMGGDENDIATAAIAGGIGGWASGGYANTKTGSVQGAATRGAVNGGVAAVASGKSADEVLRASIMGAAAGGGAQAINVSLDVGKGQVPVTDADGSQLYNEDGTMMMRQTNADQHIVNTQNNAEGNAQIYTNSAGEKMNANIDYDLNWQRPVAHVASGAWSHGVTSVANGGTFGDGAKTGAAGGTVSEVFQTAASMMTTDGTTTSDTAQASAGIVGNVTGQVLEAAQLMRDNYKPDVYTLPEYAPNAYDKEGTMNTDFSVRHAGSSDLKMKRTVKA